MDTKKTGSKKLGKLTLLALFVARPLFANTHYLEPGLHQNVGLEGYHYVYRETVNNSFFMRNKGPMLGVYYDVSFQPKDMPCRFAIEGRAAYAPNLHYHSQNTGDGKHSRHAVFEARLLGSYVMTFKSQWIVEGYVGLGIRYLLNFPTDQLTTTGHEDYSRESQYNYAPIGIRIIKTLDNEMQWVSHVEYDWFLRGLQKSKLATDIKNPQHHGYGARIGADLHIPSSTYCFSYMVGIFARYWHIGDSVKDSEGGYEPKNTTRELGIRIGIKF